MKTPNFWLVPLAWLFALAIEVRKLVYRLGWIPSRKFAVPVVSVGNLTVGGTGKTPLCILLLEEFKKRGLRPALVSRGYGARDHHVRRVTVNSVDGVSARAFGDEPTLIAQHCPDAAVWVGTPRWRACEQALVNGAEIVVLDDAFQHWAVARDLDIVVLDATEALEQYWLLPVGRGREPWSSLARAGLIILSKVNLADAQTLGSLRERLRLGQQQGWIKAQVVEMAYQIKRLRSAESQDVRSLQIVAGERILLVSGIGRPEGFRRAIAEAGAPSAIEVLNFPDHHVYSEADIAKILSARIAQSVDKIIVTEKDSVKLTQFAELISHLWIADLQLNPVANQEALIEALAQFN